MHRFWLHVLVALALLAAPAQATIRTVKTSGGDFSTVRDAMADCDADTTTVDTIMVYPGTYNDADANQIVWQPGVVLLSTEGKAVTVLADTHGSGKRFAYILNGSTGTRIGAAGQGFTIQDYNSPSTASGSSNYGGCIQLYSTTAGKVSYLTIEDCTINNCDAGNITYSGQGGALYAAVTAGSIALTVKNCVISNCWAYWQALDPATIGGGGFALIGLGTSGRAVITGTTFSANEVRNLGGYQALGGGIYGQDANVSLAACTFTANKAESGGAVQLWNPSNGKSFVVTNCTFQSNSATSRGAGLSVEHGSGLTVAGCWFDQNSTNGAGDYGGGLAAHTTSVRILNSLFTDNHANTGGGAILTGGGFGGAPAPAATVNIEGCEFQGNTAASGAGIYVPAAGATATFTLSQSTFVDNNATNGGAIYVKEDAANTQTLNIQRNLFTHHTGNAIQLEDADLNHTTYTLSCNGWYTNALGDTSPVLTCSNCVSADPVFCTFTDEGTVNDDLHLGGTSTMYGITPCGYIGRYWCACGAGCWAPSAGRRDPVTGGMK